MTLRPSLLLGLLLLPGCTGELIDITPSADLQAVAPDLATAGGDGGSGGNTDGAAPGPVKFTPDIMADIVKLSCSSASCHGTSQTPVLKDSTDPAVLMMNYMNFKLSAMSGASSTVLTKPLSGSGVTHSGGKQFSSTSDPVYQRWLGWITAGAPQ